MSTTDRYPFSTKAGQAIPLDVTKPIFLQSLNFSTGASSAVLNLPATAEVAFLRATTDCIVQFGGTPASVPVSGAPALSDCIFLEGGKPQAIALPALTLTAIAASAGGTLYIQGIEVWKSLTLESQQHKI